MTAALLFRHGRQEVGELARWVGSFGLVLGLHGAVVLGVHFWSGAEPADRPPPAALMLELAPLPASPVETPTEIPPGLRQVESAPPPEPEPEPEPVPEKIEPPPVEKPAAVLPPPPRPKPKPRPPRRDVPPQPVREPRPEPTPQPPAPATTAPQSAPVQAPVAAAPLRSAPSHAPSNAMPTWLGALRGHLERHKRYPSSAQRRGEQGTAYLRFTIDRAGRVLRYRLERSSGVAALDDETLALIRRADPLPSPPPEMRGDTLELVVPVQFFLRK